MGSARDNKQDPYTSFNFLVEIEGIISAGFSDISGLKIETEVEEFREGGVNNYVHKLPKLTKYGNLTLKHGMTDQDKLWNWYKDVIRGKINRTNVTIFLQDITGKTLMHWEFSNAYPVKWTGPELKADSNTVAFETLELAHNGLARQK